MDELTQRRDLKQALYGENVDLGEDDVMKSNDEGSIFARRMVKDLSQYVRFPDEDQDALKNLSLNNSCLFNLKSFPKLH